MPLWNYLDRLFDSFVKFKQQQKMKRNNNNNKKKIS